MMVRLGKPYRFVRTASAVAGLWVLAGLSSGCLAEWTQPRGQRGAAQATGDVSHRVTIGWLPARVQQYTPLLEAASMRHGVDANLLAIVVTVESGGDPQAVSPAGAKGLMQIMPPTAMDIAKKRGLAIEEAQLHDPALNIDFGAYYLAAQVRRFWGRTPEETVAFAAGAYNGGPGRMRRHLETGETLPAETVSYQRWVTGMWRERFMNRSATFAAWYEAGGS
ncbi:MAG: lytic transglycosylase domain-containing protein, partial [Myxococcota bacterium]